MVTPCTQPHLYQCWPTQFWYLNGNDADVGEVSVLLADGAECVPWAPHHPSETQNQVPCTP